MFISCSSLPLSMSEDECTFWWCANVRVSTTGGRRTATKLVKSRSILSALPLKSSIFLKWTATSLWLHYNRRCFILTAHTHRLCAGRVNGQGDWHHSGAFRDRDSTDLFFYRTQYFMFLFIYCSTSYFELLNCLPALMYGKINVTNAVMSYRDWQQEERCKNKSIPEYIFVFSLNDVTWQFGCWHFKRRRTAICSTE